MKIDLTKPLIHLLPECTHPNSANCRTCSFGVTRSKEGVYTIFYRPSEDEPEIVIAPLKKCELIKIRKVLNYVIKHAE